MKKIIVRFDRIDIRKSMGAGVSFNFPTFTFQLFAKGGAA